MYAIVRKIEAIGIFYPVYFECSSKDEWFEKYGDEWELHHFSRIT